MRRVVLAAGFMTALALGGCSGGDDDENAPTTSQIVFVSTRDDAVRCAAELESGAGNRCNTEIYVMNADGSGQRRLIRTAASEWSPRWSPDGTRIAFARGALGGTFTNLLIRADGTQQQRLALPPLGVFVDWSPDGKEVVYVDRGGLWVIGTDGRNARRLVAHDERKGFIMSAAWSPDGRQLAFERAGGGYGEVGAIWIANADGSETRQLTAADGTAREPAWSPDGRQIAHACYSTASDAVELCVMNPDGSDQHALTRSGLLEGVESPTWSPDGRQIAFVVSGHEHQIFVINADGSQQRQLTSTADNRWPNWQR